jgi:hypothetical protein
MNSTRRYIDEELHTRGGWHRVWDFIRRALHALRR